MALLPVLATCLAGGIALADAETLAVVPAALGASGALAGALLAGRAFPPAARGPCLACLFLFLGAVSHGSRLAESERNRPTLRHRATLEARVAAVRRSAFGVALELRDVAAIAPAAPAVPAGPGVPAEAEVPTGVRLSADTLDPAGAWLAGLAPGERIRARVRLRPVHRPANPGGRPGERALARRGIGAEATLAADGWAVKIGHGPALATTLGALRRRVGDRLGALGPGGGLLAALAVGERAGIDGADRERLQALGLAHLLAVSGLHLALVAGGAYAVLRRAFGLAPFVGVGWDARRLALFGALAAAVVYAAVTGWGVPVRRACVFLAVAVGAATARRRVRASNALAAAALVVLAIEPAALFDLGAQLSFVASAALVGSLQPGPGPGLRGALASSVRTTASAMAATAPLLALAGLRLGVPALVTNLVAIPWTAAALLPSALVAAVGAAASGDRLPAVAVMAARLGDASLAACRVAGRVVGDAVPQAPPAAWAVVVAAALAIAAVRARSTVACVVGALAVAAWLSFAPRAEVAGPDPPRLWALDVGHADAVLLQGSRGSLLVDAGGARPGRFDSGRQRVVPALAALGVDRLDVLAVSHRDVDHRGGVPAVLGALSVGSVWLPAGASRDAAFDAIRERARERGVPVLERAAGAPTLRLGDLTVDVLWPPATMAVSPVGNERSLVLRVAVGETQTLLTGDLGAEGEAALLATGADVRAHVLKVGHHGSAGGTTPAFLRAVSPSLAVVSAGCGRARGLPSPDVLERLRLVGAAVRWTGRDGAVAVALTPRLPSVGWRSRPACSPQ